MTDDLEMRRRRAAYRACHRGTKEMDFILGRFALARLPAMSGEALADFEQFIILPDPVLTQWFALDGAPEEAAFRALIAAMRDFHGLQADAPDGRERA